MAGLLRVFAVLTYVGSDALVHRFVDGRLPVRHVFISIPRQGPLHGRSQVGCGLLHAAIAHGRAGSRSACERGGHAHAPPRLTRRLYPCVADLARAQRNFTDPESRIMKTAEGLVQGDNA
jgi:hypothetical protein